MFGLNGIGGMLIATVLLLSILAGLSVWSFSVQAREADNFYKIEGEKEIKMIDKSAQAKVVDAK